MLPSGPGRHDMPFVAASSSAGADLECELRGEPSLVA